MPRIILIGKGRRITIDELLDLCLSDGELHLHDEIPDDHSPSPIEFAADSKDEEQQLLSLHISIASLALIALNICQCRHLPASQSLSLASDIVSFLQSRKKSRSDDCRLPADVSQWPSRLTSQIPLHALRRCIHLATSNLYSGLALRLCKAGDAIAALTAQQYAINPSQYFSDTLFDTHRPHRGLILSASVLRAILENSKFTSSEGAAAAPLALKACKQIPQYHGAARDALQKACKTLELEMNCFEVSSSMAENEDEEEMDMTIAGMALGESMNAVVALLDGSQCRMNIDPPSSQQQKNENVQQQQPMKVINDWTHLAQNFTQICLRYQSSLEQEAKLAVAFLQTQIQRVEQEQKEKEAAKSARAAETTSFESKTDQNNDEFKGMSETQIAKILKKRAEKEAKAAAKKKKKQQKSPAQGLFGQGVLPLCDILSKRNCQLGSNELITLTEIESCVETLLSGGQQRKPKIPKGTRDYGPEQMMIRQTAFEIIRRVFKRHGAVEIDTPVFELKDTLTGKYGEDSKLIYDLADQGGELLALRYDLTVPFARFLALNSVGNIKRFHIGKVYRRDQPQLTKGRYREFYQCDFDIAGVYGRMVPDSESVCVIIEILVGLDIGDFGIKLNHRRLLDAILDLCGVPSDKFRTICSAVDKLDKESWEDVKREMVEDKGLKTEVADKIGEFVLQKGKPWDMYETLMKTKKFGKHDGAKEALEDLRIMFDYLEAMDKLKFVSFDLSLARGLDYYTGVIYEAVCLEGNTQVGSIGGGGRYDNLVSMFQDAGKITPCVGVSVGIERVFTLMEARLREKQGHIKQPNVCTLIASVGPNMLKERMKIAKLLWDANISAEFNQQDNPKLKYEITNALDRDIPYMVIVGEEELKEHKCKVKDLQKRTEDLVKIEDLVNVLRSKGVVPVGCEFAAEMMENSGNESGVGSGDS